MILLQGHTSELQMNKAPVVCGLPLQTYYQHAHTNLSACTLTSIRWLEALRTASVPTSDPFQSRSCQTPLVVSKLPARIYINGFGKVLNCQSLWWYLSISFLSSLGGWRGVWNSHESSTHLFATIFIYVRAWLTMFAISWCIVTHSTNFIQVVK